MTETTELTAALRGQAFPVLTVDQIARLRPFGAERPTAVGDTLFAIGEAHYPLVVVLQGRTEVVDRAGGTERIIKTSGPGEFHGELGVLTGQTVFVEGRVAEAGRALVLPPAAVAEVIRTIPDLGELLVTAFAARRLVLMHSAAETLAIVGSETSAGALALHEFADRNRIPHRWVDPDDPDAPGRAAVGSARYWAVVQGDRVVPEPTARQLARAIGLELDLHQERPADLIVVGAGPAGLAAAVYGASEGLATVVIEDTAIGGQAGASSRIENYLGFPAGIAGADLAFKGEVQAVKFGARLTVPREAVALEPDDGGWCVRLDDDGRLRGRSVVIATGARYRRLGVPGDERFDGAGIYYAATEMEARFCEGAEVAVVGGGNSAGQAVMFLSRIARRVHLIHRRPDLAASMSDYLVERIRYAPNVTQHLPAHITAVHGDDRLTGVTIDGPDGVVALPVVAVFALIGADPCTDWLRGTLELDAQGFVVTGYGGAASPYCTSQAGVFAVGDVRAGSVKRVASAVGEGSVVVATVHRYLAEAQAMNGPATIASSAS